jgi:hypothetical protein
MINLICYSDRPQIKNFDASPKKLFIGDLSNESIEKKVYKKNVFGQLSLNRGSSSH